MSEPIVLKCHNYVNKSVNNTITCESYKASCRSNAFVETDLLYKKYGMETANNNL